MSIDNILNQNYQDSMSNYYTNNGSASDVISSRDALINNTSASNYYDSIINDSFNNLANGTGTDSDKLNAINAAKAEASTSTDDEDINSRLLENTIANLANQDSSTSSNVIGTVLSSGLSSLTSSLSNQSDRRIKLRPKIGISTIASNSIILSPLVTTNGFIFPWKPRFSVRNSARYGSQSISHANQDFKYYINTPSQTFSINGDLTAQTTDQAKYMVAAFHFFSLVTKMRFGTSDSNAGLPPPILLLSGYGPYMFNDLPVIVEDFSYVSPNDVDFVTVDINGVKTDVPSLTNISLTVTVQNTPEKLRSFNWDQFASGQLLSTTGWK